MKGDKMKVDPDTKIGHENWSEVLDSVNNVKRTKSLKDKLRDLTETSIEIKLGYILVPIIYTTVLTGVTVVVLSKTQVQFTVTSRR
jgi:hypothetical protein